MRLGPAHDQPSVEVFVYGVKGGAYPARQHLEATRAIARLNRLDPDRVLFVAQSEAAIAAGAFHNDVVAVANENVLFAHEQAFEDRSDFYAALRRLLPDVEIVEVPAAAVSLEDAIRSYLFNAQLVTLPTGAMALIVPEEAHETPGVWRWLEEMTRGNGPIREIRVVDVRQSMANGGGPACLRLRVVANPDTVDPRFLVDESKLDRLTACVGQLWPEQIAPADLKVSALQTQIETARRAAYELLDLADLI
jgi:succinylarginine dihydrolase